MTRTVLVTRPEPQASQWAQALRDQGLLAMPLPLMSTVAPTDAAPVQRLWQTLHSEALAPASPPGWRALMFVSPAAVQWFFAQRPADLAPAPWPVQTWLAAPGLGTAQALRQALTALPGPAPGACAGPVLLHPPADAAQFDSEHLWPVLAPLDWSGQHVAIISGGDAEQAKGRQWLTARWQSAGAQVHTVLTYQRGPSTWSPDEQALARRAWQAPEAHTWLCSSSEALQLLQTHHLPALGLAQPPQGHRLLATHPRIAEVAHTLGWQNVETCAPTLEAVSAALRNPP